MNNEYQVGDEHLQREEIKIRTMNFGQNWREDNVVDVPLRVQLPNQFVDELINKELEQYKQDAISHPDKDSVLEQLLQKENWPKAPEVFAKNSQLTEEVLRYFSHNLLLDWFGESQPERIRFVINQVVNVSREEEYTILECKGRTIDASTKYQDS